MTAPAGRDETPAKAITRPLLIIFLTILVNLIGFGIIIPLLPFYAETFGASPVVIGMLFASFSISQLVASPVLGDLSDRWGRRPILIFSLLGTVVSFVMLALAHSLAVLFAARIIDGLSGGNITTARAYIGDVTDESNRARAFGMLGAAFGLGFIIGPALGGLFAHISYTAPIWAAAAITVVATALAWAWLPETVHRVHAIAGSPWKNLVELSRRHGLRTLFAIDFCYWTCFAVYQGTFALFGEAAVRFRRREDWLHPRGVRDARRHRAGRARRAGRPRVRRAPDADDGSGAGGVQLGRDGVRAQRPGVPAAARSGRARRRVLQSRR